MDSDWTTEWLGWKTGASCPLCEEGRPTTGRFGHRFYSSGCADAYLLNRESWYGSSIVVWRGSHAVELTDLTEADALRYWHDVMTVTKALTKYFSPLKLNLSVFGNTIPHLHTTITLRFLKDSAAGEATPWLPNPTRQSEERLLADVDALGSMIET